MARLARLYVSGCSHHIIQRGNDRSPCFFHKKDFAFYLQQLLISSQKFGVAIHAYVLMNNHVHLLVTPSDRIGCGKMMQSLGRKYVQYINITYERTGTLWEGRYKSTLVDSDNYFLTVSRYIELNPVRANMVLAPDDYVWSSYRANAMGTKISLITPHACYEALGKTKAQRILRYRSLFDDAIPEETIADIRECTNKSWALGSIEFKEDIAKIANRRVKSRGWGGDRRSKGANDQGV